MSWLCLSGRCSLHQCQVVLAAGTGHPPAAARHLPTACVHHPAPSASRAVRNTVSWVFSTTLPLALLVLFRCCSAGCGCRVGRCWRHCWGHRVFWLGEKAVLPQHHAPSAFWFHFKPMLFGRKVGLLPRAEPRMYWIRPKGHLTRESLSASGQTWVLPKNALRFPGAVQCYPMESAGKAVT